MAFENIGFIGLGLIGGSIAKTLKRLYPEKKLYATSGHLSTVTEAYEDHTIENNTLLSLEEIGRCDLIFLCAPVQKNIEYLAQLKPFLGEHTIVTDVGSVKSDIHAAASSLGLTRCFIGGHPMTGSEKTGYANATAYLLENAYYVLTPTAENPADQVAKLTTLVESLGALPIVLEHDAHDHATATISHLPHIVAASLVNLVQRLDDQQETMKTIAAGGFKDITRIASSSPVMWESICLSNRAQILDIMDRFVEELAAIRTQIAASNRDAINGFFCAAKDYRDSITIKGSGPIKKVFELYCDLIDEAGGIATIATILASNNLSIKNIGIIHNREFEDGVLHLEMYDGDSLQKSVELLRKYHYTVYER
ncbi:prephenate dehydrogenase [Lachnospiraceae bacterium 47-T17]